MHFISLVSENHKLREICIEQVLQNNQMMNLGRLSAQKNASEYHIQEMIQDYHGITLRCIVVYSTHLAEQKKATEELTEQEFSSANACGTSKCSE